MTIKIWDTINDLTKRKQANNHVEHILIDSQSVSGKPLTEKLNDLVVNSGQYAEQHDYTEEYRTTANPSPHIMLAPKTPSEVITIISSLKNNVAAGDDGIKALPIKYIAAPHNSLLSDVIKIMLLIGDSPDQLKLAKVIPAYKESRAKNIHTYTPTSLLPICGKIYERGINDGLTSFFQMYDIITKYQYESQKDKSTEEALLDIKGPVQQNSIGMFFP